MSSLTKDSRDGKSKYWICCYTSTDGRQLKRSTKCTNKREAEIVCHAWAEVEDLARGNDLTEKQVRQVIQTTLERVTGKRVYDPTVRDTKMIHEKPKVLYVLPLIDEPLLKMGYTNSISSRIIQLGENRFDLGNSFRIYSQRKYNSLSVRDLEARLKLIFAHYQQYPDRPLTSGNSEVYSSAMLPILLKIIKDDGRWVIGSGIYIQKRRPTR